MKAERATNEMYSRLLPYIDNPDVSTDKKVTRVIHVTAALCALVAVQPIPFADIFVLTPIQVVMVLLLGRVYGLQLTRRDAAAILTSILGAIGWGVMAQQVTLGLYKTVLPFMGGFTTIPIVYAWTWGLGKTAAYFLKERREGRTPSADELKSVAEHARREGTERAARGKEFATSLEEQ